MSCTYIAGAFRQDFTGGKAIGQVRANPHSLEFTSRDYPDLYIKIPLQDLKLSLGGAQKRLLFLEHPLFRDTTLYTSDHKILNDPNLNTFAPLAKQIQKIKHGKTSTWLILLGVLVSLSFIAIGLFQAKKPIVNYIVNRIPVEYERNIGDLLLNQMLGQEKAIRDPMLNQMTQELLKPLLESIDQVEYPIQLHLSKDSELNAYALPGGHIVLNKGFLTAVDRPEEILGVVAHEIAHVTERHILQNIVSGFSTYLLFDALIGNYSGILAMIAEQGPFLLLRKFSRYSEQEADNVAFQKLVQLGIDPRGLKSFLMKLKKRQDQLSSESELPETTFSLFSTHPATIDRIDDLTNMYKNLPRETKRRIQSIDFELSSYQELLSGF